MIFKQLRRFLKSCDQPLSPPRSQLGEQLEPMRWKFHTHEVRTLPAKIGRWMTAGSDAAKLAGGGDRIPTLVNNLQVFADRMRELAELQRAAQSEVMMHGLHDDLQASRRGNLQVLSRLVMDPASLDAAALRSRLWVMAEALETRIESTLTNILETKVTLTDS